MTRRRSVCCCWLEERAAVQKSSYINEAQALNLVTYGSLGTCDNYLFRIRIFWGSKERYDYMVVVFVLQALIVHAWADHCPLVPEHAQGNGWEKLTSLSFAGSVVTLARKMLQYDGERTMYLGEDIPPSYIKDCWHTSNVDTDALVAGQTDTEIYTGRRQHKVSLQCQLFYPQH